MVQSISHAHILSGPPHPGQVRNLSLLIQCRRILARPVFPPTHLLHWAIEGLPTGDLAGHRKKLLINHLLLLPPSSPTSSAIATSTSNLWNKHMAHHFVTCPVQKLHINHLTPHLLLDVGFCLYLPRVRFCEKDANGSVDLSRTLPLSE